MKTTAVVACALLAFAAPGLTLSPPAGCVPGSGLSTNAARKIAIVVDSSGSNGSNDPDDLRIVAAKGLNDLLTSKAEAGASGKPDLVTVVDFDSSAAVIFPLGDPDAAAPSFDNIDSSGGTDVADGLLKALDELQKGGNTAKRSGIVILTDGESSEDPIVEQLVRAKSMGVRVILGFLQPPPPSTPASPSAAIVEAIKGTGGMYAGINSPAAQKAFINAVIAHGPTENDSGSGSTGNELFPGLSKVAPLTTGSATFTYTALAGEKLNFTIASPDASTALKCTLRSTGGAVLKTADTSADTGIASFLWTATAGSSVELVVKGPPTVDEVVTVSLNSSIPRTDICKPVTNTTTPVGGGKNTTNTSTTTGPKYTHMPPTYTGAAATVAARQGLVTFGLVMVGLCAFSWL